MGRVQYTCILLCFEELHNHYALELGLCLGSEDPTSTSSSSIEPCLVPSPQEIPRSKLDKGIKIYMRDRCIINLNHEQGINPRS